jgi:hypothetical protein
MVAILQYFLQSAISAVQELRSPERVFFNAGGRIKAFSWSRALFEAILTSTNESAAARCAPGLQQRCA